MKEVLYIPVSKKELIWLLPFICIVFMSFSLCRSTPYFPPLTNGRTVVDAAGKTVTIPDNFMGVVPVHTFHLSVFLEKTHAPEKLAKAGSPNDRQHYVFSPFRRDLMDWVFPAVPRDDTLWDFPTDLESILANDQEGYIYLADFMYLGPIRFDNLQKTFGLNTISYSPPSTYPRRPTFKEIDNSTVTMASVLNDVIGQKEMAEVYTADYKKDMAQLVEELDLETIQNRPTVLSVGSSANDWTYVWFGGDFDERLGLNNSSDKKRAMGREQDAERLLYIDPDIIFCGEGKTFYSDPRWRGLKAVREKRVYPGPRFNPWENDSNFYPLGLRYTAEVIYPERLAPKLRQMIREKFEKNYGFRLKDSEIDFIFNMNELKQSPFLAQRFGRES
jgi:ABC-type Fe3+-hydroxamate transport system substrate-binding protein